MAGLLQIDLVANHLTCRILDEVRRPDNTTDDANVVRQNKQSYNTVTNLLSNALKSLGPESRQTSAAARATSISKLEAQTYSLEVAPVAVTKKDVVKETVNTLSGKMGKSFDPAIKALQDMAKAGESIKKSFDDLLTQPYLDQHNALLNTAPIVGLSQRNIKYLNIKSAQVNGKTNLVEEWEHFDEIPKEADLSSGAVHLFPYNGQFYLAVGRSLWRKTARAQSDDLRKEAKNSWPRLFEAGWKKVGHESLPSSDLRVVTAYAEGVTPKSPMKFYLIVVDKDGVLKVNKADDLGSSNTFDPILFKQSGGQKTSPKWKFVTYCAGKLFGIDESNQSWNINVPKGVGSFSIENPMPQEPVRGLTMNDVGVVAARPDGYLWRRFVDGNISSPDESLTTDKWIKWKAYGDITNIGVASPGVFLDLRTLTASLRDQYMRSQVAIWPVATKIQAFSAVHKTYLERMKETSQTYAAASEDDRVKIKEQSAKQTWRHITRWAKKLHQASNASKDTVAEMSAGVTGVSQDLRSQIKSIRERIKTLQKVLEGQREELESIKNVQMWALIVILVSFLVIMVAMAFGFGLVALGAGVVFLGAFITEKIYESKEDDCKARIARTESEISSLETSISQLESLAEAYDGVNQKYQDLNKFWGRMADAGGTLLNTYDSDIETLFMEEMENFWEDDQVTTAIQYTTRLEEGAQAYLDSLYAQGIYIPTDVPDQIQTTHMLAASRKETPNTVLTETLEHLQATETTMITAPELAEKLDALDASPNSIELPLRERNDTDKEQMSGTAAVSNALLDLSVNDNVSSAPLEAVTRTFVATIPSEVLLLTEAAYEKSIWMAKSYLIEGDFDSYFKYVDLSAQIMMAPEIYQHRATIRSGEWFDIELISNNASLWSEPSLQRLLGYVKSTDAVRHLHQAQTCAETVISSAVELGRSMDQWASALRLVGSSEDRDLVSAQYSQAALVACGVGQAAVVKLNNAFTDVNRDVSAAQQQVETDIKLCEDQINQLDYKLWDQIQEINDEVPTLIRIFGDPIKWATEKVNDLQRERDNAAFTFELRKSELSSLINSGHVFNDQSLTWKGLAQRISTMLGQIYQQIIVIREEIDEDPSFYASDILDVAWPALIKNGQAVLGLMGSTSDNALQVQILSKLAVAEMQMSADRIIKEDADTERKNLQDERERDILVDAVAALPPIAPRLTDSSTYDNKFFKTIQDIRSLPHVRLVKAYAQNTVGPAVSLHDFCVSVLNSYTEAARKRNRTVNSLKAMALIQGSLIARLQSGRKTWDAFVDEYTLRMADAIHFAQKAADDIESSHEVYEGIFRSIEHNKKLFDAKIVELDALAAAESKKVTEHNFQVAADGAALLVISVAAGAAVIWAPTTALQVAMTAHEAASLNGALPENQYSVFNTFKSLYSKMNWEEMKKSLASWGILRETLKCATDDFAEIRSTLKETTDCTRNILKHLREMQTRVRDYSDQIDALGWTKEEVREVIKTSLDEERMTSLRESWQNLANACDACLDSLNAQGIYSD